VIFIGYFTFLLYAHRVSRIDKRISMPEYVVTKKRKCITNVAGFHFEGPVKQGRNTSLIVIFADLLRSQVPVESR